MHSHRRGVRRNADPMTGRSSSIVASCSPSLPCNAWPSAVLLWRYRKKPKSSEGDTDDLALQSLSMRSVQVDDTLLDHLLPHPDSTDEDGPLPRLCSLSIDNGKLSVPALHRFIRYRT